MMNQRLTKYVWPESDKLKIAIEGNRVLVRTTFPIIKFQFSCNEALPVPTLDGLAQLIKRGHLSQALFLTSELLKQKKFAIAENSETIEHYALPFEIWSCRFQIMMALLKFDELAEELNAFHELDEVDSYFLFSPNLAACRGSAIPFCMRAIHATIPLYSNNPHSAILRILKLKTNAQKAFDIVRSFASTGPDIMLWENRLTLIEYTLAAAFYRLKEYGLSLKIYESLLGKTSDMKTRIHLLKFLVRYAVSIGDEKLMLKQMNALNNLGESIDDILCFKEAFYGNFDSCRSFLPTVSKSIGSAEFSNNQAIFELYSGSSYESLRILLEHECPIVLPLFINVQTVADFASDTAHTSELKHNYLLKHSVDSYVFFQFNK